MSSHLTTQMRFFCKADERGHVLYLAIEALRNVYKQGIERGKGLALNTITGSLTDLIFPKGNR
jgi:hypothetical protein